MEKSAAALRIFPFASQFTYCKHFTSGTFFTTNRFTDNLASISAKKTDYELLGRGRFQCCQPSIRKFCELTQRDSPPPAGVNQISQTET